MTWEEALPDRQPGCGWRQEAGNCQTRPRI